MNNLYFTYNSHADHLPCFCIFYIDQNQPETQMEIHYPNPSYSSQETNLHEYIHNYATPIFYPKFEEQ